jgi:hypothetical protein
VIETDINFDNTLPKATAQKTILVTESQINANPRRLTKVHHQGVQARFGFAGNDAILVWDSIVKFKISKNTIEYQSLGANEKTLKLFTLSEAIGIALFLKGNFVLHGSGVLTNDKAQVFIGEPEAGKSTTATAFWKTGKVILSDDLSVIKFIDEKPYALPAFPQLKVWKDALNGLRIDTEGLEKSTEGGTKYLIQQSFEKFPREPIPLESITVLLKKNSKDKEKYLSVLQAPIELLKHFPLPTQLLKGEFIKNHFLTSIELAKTVEIKQLKRPKTYEKLEEFVSSTSI